MHKETITYTDYNGVERTEDFYFNLTKAEINKMEISAEGGGGLEALIRKAIQASDGKTIIDTFDKIILSAYGEKSPDGRRFIKSPEISKAFMETPAYDKLFMELMDGDNAAKFIAKVIPQEKK